MFDMEADRIRDLAFDPKIIESERGVVYSERRSSVDNSNGGMLSELAQRHRVRSRTRITGRWWDGPRISSRGPWTI